MIRTYLAVSVLLAFFSLTDLPAHATGIDDFLLVGEGHTITYSLPDSGVVMDHPHGVTWNIGGSTTIDGISGYTTAGQYYVPRLSLPSMILSVPSSIDGGELVLWGPNVVSATVIPISAPTLEHPDDLLVTFVPGTYNFIEFNPFLGFPKDDAPYTLTITAEATATPEPSGLILLATGSLGVVGVVRSRRFRRTADGGVSWAAST